MTSKNKNYSVSEAWELLLDEYNIVEDINKYGFYKIPASTIKDYKEPRNMTKWDTSNSRPEILKENKLGILPLSTKEYIISDFKLYEKLPDLIEIDHKKVIKVPTNTFEEYESIDINNISSEATAINVMTILEILDDFLETPHNVATFNGRMFTKAFNFKIDTFNSGQLNVDVKGVQVEIDGGFENSDSVVIVEAKNVLSNDFIVRQLYYPYRLWSAKVNKPIRTVFMVYTNMIFRLFEYEFKEQNNYSSIKLVKHKIYTIDDIEISLNEIIDVYNSTKEKYSDDINERVAPFVQADSMDRIISLLESLYKDGRYNENEIASKMSIAKRQSGYYFNAGKYLGLFTKKIDPTDKKRYIYLTSLGKQIYRLPYKERQLKIIELIFEHRVFRMAFEEILKNATLPSINKIEGIIDTCNAVEKSKNRRAQSVIAWLKWMIALTEL
ncbi:hypothetical protein ERX37_03470 [Macrococcus hajekii]|uniref:Type II restriction endonuclease n=1 Tax=Macrococcus hajekii TaxID=198482 RepID=A0A4R6BN35_9STAP|nr:hypothetical protein [Macrococcus hajekii]TDM03158.1 hypothetical protein ERX37_03470 [Macrococcus hajekii]GGA96428.1 hypothetical protein GCM10007190_00610 [Macrococcus hajekii]